MSNEGLWQRYHGLGAQVYEKLGGARSGSSKQLSKAVGRRLKIASGEKVFLIS